MTCFRNVFGRHSLDFGQKQTCTAASTVKFLFNLMLNVFASCAFCQQGFSGPGGHRCHGRQPVKICCLKQQEGMRQLDDIRWCNDTASTE